MSDTSILLITFYYFGYQEGYCADFVLTEIEIAYVCMCLCLWVLNDLCFCVFTLTLTLAEEGRDTYPEVSETSEERDDKEPRVPVIMSCHPPTL